RVVRPLDTGGMHRFIASCTGSVMVTGKMQLQSKPIQRIRMPFIDGLRGLAAVAVLLPHAIGLFYFSVKNPISQLMIRVSEYGHYGVEVFFVISGFVIAYSLKNTVMTGKNWGKFILR